MILPSQKELFDIPADTSYLNCAYMSPTLRKSAAAGISAIQKRCHPWQFKIPGDWFDPAETLRSLFAQIIHSGKDNIALVPSASYGIAVAANNILLDADQEIILLDQEYPSNVYAWRELSKKTGATIVTVKKETGENWTDAILSKINAQTGLVAVTNCHWTEGSIIDLEKVSAAAKKVNASLVIDASQSLGAFPLDITKIKPDFLVTVGYKWLMGPYNLSYLYADEKYFESGKPIEFSWLNKEGSEDFARLVDYRDEYKYGARRFDVGGFPGFIHVSMAIEALTQILGWGVKNIQESISVLTDAIEIKAKQLGLETPDRSARVGHMIGIKFPGDQLSALSKKLAENRIIISVRGTSMRVAPHLYNDAADIERLFNFF